MTGKNYNILPTKEFSKDFRKLSSFERKTVKKKIENLSENPTRHKHLHYGLKSSCRLRVGKLRIIFSYNTYRNEIYLEKIVFKHKYE